MQNNKPIVQEEISLVPESTKRKILEKTPKQFVKTRQGRGGLRLSYIETGYVISKLNEVFNYLWDFEVLEEKIGKEQVYVRGKITAHISPTLAITKTQYGGSQIKTMASGQTIDIADDLKAAASDCLKKCASMFGIGQDIFWPTGSEYQEDEKTTPTAREMRQTVEEKEDPDPNVGEMKTLPATTKQRSFITRLMEEGKIPDVEEDTFRDWLDDLDIAQASNVIAQATGAN